MVLLVRVLLSDNRDFPFHPTFQPNLTFYSHIVDEKTLKVLIKNANDQSFFIFHQYKLDHLLDMNYDNCFFIDTQSAYEVATVLPSSHSFSNVSTGPMLLLADFWMKTIFNNGIRVYGNTNIIK